MQPGQQQIGEDHPEHHQQQQPPTRVDTLFDQQIAQPDGGQAGKGEQEGVDTIGQGEPSLGVLSGRHH